MLHCTTDLRDRARSMRGSQDWHAEHLHFQLVRCCISGGAVVAKAAAKRQIRRLFWTLSPDPRATTSLGGLRMEPGQFLERPAGAVSLAFASTRGGAAPEHSRVKAGVLHSLSGMMTISETVMEDLALMAFGEIDAKGWTRTACGCDSRLEDEGRSRGRLGATRATGTPAASTDDGHGASGRAAELARARPSDGPRAEQTRAIRVGVAAAVEWLPPLVCGFAGRAVGPLDAPPPAWPRAAVNDATKPLAKKAPVAARGKQRRKAKR